MVMFLFLAALFIPAKWSFNLAVSRRSEHHHVEDHVTKWFLILGLASICALLIFVLPHVHSMADIPLTVITIMIIIPVFGAWTFQGIAFSNDRGNLWCGFWSILGNAMLVAATGFMIKDVYAQPPIEYSVVLSAIVSGVSILFYALPVFTVLSLAMDACSFLPWHRKTNDDAI